MSYLLFICSCWGFWWEESITMSIDHMNTPADENFVTNFHFPFKRGRLKSWLFRSNSTPFQARVAFLWIVFRPPKRRLLSRQFIFTQQCRGKGAYSFFINMRCPGDGKTARQSPVALQNKQFLQGNSTVQWRTVSRSDNSRLWYCSNDHISVWMRSSKHLSEPLYNFTAPDRRDGTWFHNHSNGKFLSRYTKQIIQ